MTFQKPKYYVVYDISNFRCTNGSKKPSYLKTFLIRKLRNGKVGVKYRLVPDIQSIPLQSV